MCGIAGLIQSGVDLSGRKSLLEKMSESLKMRGPDGAGSYISGSTALLHRRLAVIDIENGAQPMYFGKYIIVYNGELYNTQEIKKELEEKGHRFDTNCDTEVVLKAYAQWE